MTSSWSQAPSLLSLIGAVMVYSATRVELAAVGDDPKFYLKRQLVWLAIGLVVMVVVALVDYHWLEQSAYVIYGLVVLALLAVLTHFGHVSLGAQRWFAVGPLEVQPSEFAALALILVVAVYCSRQETMFPRNIVVVLVLAAMPILLVYKQPDSGTALIMTVVLTVMIVTSGARLRYLVVLDRHGGRGPGGGDSFQTDPRLRAAALSRRSSTRTPARAVPTGTSPSRYWPSPQAGPSAPVSFTAPRQTAASFRPSRPTSSSRRSGSSSGSSEACSSSRCSA